MIIDTARQGREPWRFAIMKVLNFPFCIRSNFLHYILSINGSQNFSQFMNTRRRAKLLSRALQEYTKHVTPIIFEGIVMTRKLIFISNEHISKHVQYCWTPAPQILLCQSESKIPKIQYPTLLLDEIQKLKEVLRRKYYITALNSNLSSNALNQWSTISALEM